jgi:large subunit ribosomal protein L21
MYAVVDDRSSQYRVQPGDRIRIHYRRDAEAGATLVFDRVCLVGGEGQARIGTPYVQGAKVTARVVVGEEMGPKLVVVKFRRCKNSKRRTGFRARYTQVQIQSIDA